MLLTQIKDALLKLRKEGTQKKQIAILTLLYSEAANVGFNDGKRQTTDAETSAVIKKMIKSADDCIVAAISANKPTDSYIEEKTILSAFLPQQLCADQLRLIIAALIKEGNTKKSDVMRELKTGYAGQYDGKLAVSIFDSMT